MEINHLKTFHMTHLENFGEFIIFFYDKGKRYSAYRHIVRRHEMVDIPFHLGVYLPAYLEDGTEIKITAVQAMYESPADRIMLTYEDKGSTVCVTANDIRDLRIYVTDPRPFMTTAGQVLYGT